jgi:hypothetical protein
VAAFVAAADFCEGTIINSFLCGREASQIEWVIVIAGMVAFRHFGELLGHVRLYP